MFKAMKKAASTSLKGDAPNDLTSASTSLKGDAPNDLTSTYSSATTLKGDDASDYTLTPGMSQQNKKTGFLTKLGAKKDGLLEKIEAGTPMARSKALQKQLKESGQSIKGRSDNNPTYPVIYVI
jgi:hypothetical protein